MNASNMKKLCFRCNEVKNFVEFYKNITTKRGISPYCKKCTRAYLKLHYGAARKQYFAKYRQTDHYKEIHKKSSKAYVAKYPERQRARFQARRLVAKDEKCSLCGISEIRLHLHHSDYSKPLQVITVCQPCHEPLHHGI